MKHISIKVSDIINKLLPETLEKDLQDDEIICPDCGGTGISVRHQPFGLKETDDRYSKMNWYDNKYMTFCPTCYTGVVNTCVFCGKPTMKGYISKCDCEGYKAQEHEKELQKYQERINKAVCRPLDEFDTYLYCEENDKYYSEVEDFVEDYYEDEFEDIPQILWFTSKQDLSIDAGNIIESACDDLHEDASDNFDYESLQKMLNEWCDKQSGTTSYTPDYTMYVKVEKEWFKRQ